MTRVVWIAAAIFAVSSMPTASFAKVTHQQLTQACRGPLDALVRETIAGHVEDIASRKRDVALIGTGTTDHFTKEQIQKERNFQEAEIRGVEQQLAAARANGIDAGEMREYFDQAREAGATATKDQIRKGLAEVRGQSGPQTAAEICLLETLLADREGRLSPVKAAPLVPPATSQSSSATAATAPNRPTDANGTALPSRIIASDGKSAMDCVKLVELTKTDSNMGGGGRVLSNQCAGPVEITWCYSPGDCDPGRVGNVWTVGPGRSWPVSAEQNIRWAACHGANTASFVKDSQGLQYYCSAPAKR